MMRNAIVKNRWTYLRNDIMAHIESIVGHVLHREVGLTEEQRKLSPKEMYACAATHGYHVIKDDKGGPTMCGVTMTTFIEWRLRQGRKRPTLSDLKNLDYNEWLSILKQMFWDSCEGDRIDNASVALMLVDWRWVNGTQAVRDMQTAFSLVQDGIVGPKTLAALNSKPAETVFMRLRYAREAAYRKIVHRNPTQKKFLNGWINRTRSIVFKP